MSLKLGSFLSFVLVLSACGMNNFAKDTGPSQPVCASADCTDIRPNDTVVVPEETEVAGTVDTTFGTNGYLLFATGKAIDIAKVNDTYALACQFPNSYLGKIPTTASRLDTFSASGVAGKSTSLSPATPAPMGSFAVAALEGGNYFHALAAHALEGTSLVSLDATPKSVAADSLNETGFRILPSDSARNGRLIAIAGTGVPQSKQPPLQSFIGFALETEIGLKPVRYVALATEKEASEATAVSAYQTGFVVGFKVSGKSDIVLARFAASDDATNGVPPQRTDSVTVPLELDARVEGLASHESRTAAVVSLPDSQRFYVVLLEGMTVVARIAFERPDREKILPQDVSFSEDGKMIYVGGHLKDTKRGFLLKLKAADGAITSGFGWRTVQGYVNHLLVEKDRVLFVGESPSANPTIFSQGRAMVGALHR